MSQKASERLSMNSIYCNLLLMNDNWIYHSKITEKMKMFAVMSILESHFS